jgi:integration host factor subunit alpha
MMECRPLCESGATFIPSVDAGPPDLVPRGSRGEPLPPSEKQSSNAGRRARPLGQKTLTRAEIARKANVNLPHLSKGQLKLLIDEVIMEMIDSIVSDGGLTLPSFGSFRVRIKPARPGRNPKTGVPAVVTARRVVCFQPSPRLKAAVSSPSPTPHRERQFAVSRPINLERRARFARYDLAVMQTVK